MLAAAASLTAQADIVVNRTGGPTPVGANFQWDYTARLENHPLENGDFFAIFDFTGFVSEVAHPAGWSFAAEFVTPQPLTQVPDNATIRNLRWTWTGAPVTTNMTWSPFSVLSTVGGPGTSVFYVALTDGGMASNLGPTVGPAAGGPTPVAEPGSLLLIAGGAVLLLLMRRPRLA